MNPCEICGDRILVYPGVCDPCNEHRHQMAAEQRMPSYEAATERLNATVQTAESSKLRWDDQQANKKKRRTRR